MNDNLKKVIVPMRILRDGETGTRILRERVLEAKVHEKSLKAQLPRVRLACRMAGAEGLAANQVGVRGAWFWIGIEAKAGERPDEGLVIEPEYESIGEAIESSERSPSEPGFRYLMQRWSMIRAQFRGLGSEERVEVTLSGRASVVYQRLYDQLCGIRLQDRCGERFKEK